MKKYGWIAVVLVVAALVSITIVRRRDRTGLDPEPALSAESLRNMTYQSHGTRSGKVTITDGRFEDPAGHVWVTMLDTIAWGDVTGDGRTDAVVVLGTNTGGSGVFHSLALVSVVDGKPVNIAVADLGDRIKLQGISIEGGKVLVEMVTHGPSDPMCCPTMKVTRTYRYDGEELRMIKQIPPEIVNTSSPD
jgi:hypothetical protein